MGIYSFNHDTFGKTTNRAGAAGQNAAYNARDKVTELGPDGQDRRSAARNAAYNGRQEATYAIRSHVIPPDAKAAEAWFHEQEKSERKNARMSDRFIAALPRELTPEQCLEEVEGFCRAVTKNRIPWHFALHLELEKKGDPDWNPHTHIIFRDRDIETGKRFLYTSAGPKDRAKLAAKGVKAWSTKDFRVAWAEHMNRALERAGHTVRIDHRTLKEQGIDRKPQIHIGPGGRMAAAKGKMVESRDLEKGGRIIPYSLFDNGTRAEHNARIVQANAQRDAARASPQAENREAHERTAEATSVSAMPAACWNAGDHGLLQSLESDNRPSRNDLLAPKYPHLPHTRDSVDLHPRPILPPGAAPLHSSARASTWRAIGEDYLALCRDPGRDLVSWANETIEPETAGNPHVSGDAQQGGLPPPRTPPNVADALVEDYLALCSDPGRDLLGWVNETIDGHGWENPAAGRKVIYSQGSPAETAKTLAATPGASAAWAGIDDSHTVCRNRPNDPGLVPERWKREIGNNATATLKPRSDDARSSFRLRENPLRPVQIRLGPCYERWSRSPDLPSRPEASLQNDDALHALQSRPGHPSDLDAVFPGEPDGGPGHSKLPSAMRRGRGPPGVSFDEGEEALRMLQLCFAELSRFVRRQLAHAAKTAPRHELDLIQRYIIEERERHAAFLMKQFRENRANAIKRNREKARVSLEPLRPRTSAPPGMTPAQRKAQMPARGSIAAPH